MLDAWVMASEEIISIHALTRSATSIVRRYRYMQLKLYFNPRTHEECDEATARHGHERRQGDFNPRTHEECDGVLASRNRWIKAFGFQSTHSRGVRHKWLQRHLT